MPRRRASLVGLFLLAVGVVLGWGLSRLAPAPAAADGEDAAQLPAPEEMSAEVEVALARTGDLPLVLFAAGTVRADPAGELRVATRASGRILEVAVAPGQTVHRGDLLARIDSAPLLAARAEAQARAIDARAQRTAYAATGRETERADLVAATARARSAAALADAALERTRGLHADGLSSDRALAEAQQASELAASEQGTAQRALDAFEASGAELASIRLAAEVEAAEAALADADLVLAEADVRAPADGQIVALDAAPGTWIDSGAELARLVVPGARVVSFGVPVGAARGLSPGARAWWTDPAGAQRTGTVARVFDQVSSDLGLIEVIAIPTAGEPNAPPSAAPLPIGLAVRGELEIGTLVNVVLVPERAVVRAEDQRVVVVASPDDRARVVPVELLGLHAGLAAVAGDVTEGERVVVAGGYNLPDGARLIAKPAAGGAGR